MSTCRVNSLLLVGFLVLAVVVSGCSSGKGPPRTNEDHMQKAALLFTKCMQKNRGKPPTSEKELADFVKSMPQSELDAMGIADREKALISPRDGEPYAVNSKVDMSMMSGGKNTKQTASSKPPIAMYEKKGFGGKRYVVYLAGGSVVEMPDAEFYEIVPGAK